jgi:hypothetical protein
LIAVSWTEATRTVTFAARDGGWTGKGGALAKRRFAVVVVSPGHGAGAAREPQPDAVQARHGEHSPHGSDGRTAPHGSTCWQRVLREMR